jgi:hypothetical protein
VPLPGTSKLLNFWAPNRSLPLFRLNRDDIQTEAIFKECSSPSAAKRSSGSMIDWQSGIGMNGSSSVNGQQSR